MPPVLASLDRSLYLASRSPRRRELLAQIGVRFHLLMFRARPDGDEVSEEVLAGESPRAYVERIAMAKAEMGWKRLMQRNLPRAPVLAADTTVALEGRIFGKPADRADAARMLAELSGREHEVLSAVVLKYDERTEAELARTMVQFRALSEDEIRQYVASGEADDKAGAYAIQGRAAQFIAAIRGSYSGVVGLPLYETAQAIERMGTARERRSPY
ncbi:MAG TPA: nucleoside triphosphate pyrophosphatase [Burkholderiales bacterium]|nr:nucleoside triphosphate pyrophosphatase [Burkholderiales bacterium]